MDEREGSGKRKGREFNFTNIPIRIFWKGKQEEFVQEAF